MNISPKQSGGHFKMSDLPVSGAGGREEVNSWG